jgi:putative MATE family efflux protein
MPILAANILQSLNASINTAWIGRLIGPAALSASANSTNILFFLLSLGLGFGFAATILVAQSVGARNLDQAKRVVGTTLVFFAMLSILIGASGFFMASRVLSLMGAPPETLPLASAYLRIIFLAMPGVYLFTFAIMALRGAGDAKTPFIFMAVSAVLDVVLNPLLIRGLGPIPAMGIAGSALATLIGQWAGFFGLVFWMYRTRHFLRLRQDELRYLRIDVAVFRALVTKGIPMGLQVIVLSSSAIAMISLVNRFGYLTSAAYGACFQLWSYIQMPAFAVGQAVSSMVAQNIGARRWDRVGRIAGAGVLYSALLTGSMVLAVGLAGGPVFAVFLGGNAEAIGIARHIDYVTSWSFIMFGVSFVLSSTVRSTGAVVPPLVNLIVALWMVRIPFALALTPKFQAEAIWWSFPLGFAVALALNIAYYRWGNWTKAHMLES